LFKAVYKGQLIFTGGWLRAKKFNISMSCVSEKIIKNWFPYILMRDRVSGKRKFIISFG